MEKRKVIYVDDEEINLRLFRMNFDPYYDLTVCEYPEEALRMIKEENIDIIITDYKMPGMSGMELIEEVKKFNQRAVCMILSGYLESEVILDHSKVFRFIAKPYGKKEVILDLVSEATAGSA